MTRPARATAEETGAEPQTWPGAETRGAEPAAGVVFRLLGPVDIHDGPTGTSVVPAGSKQRALLCAFVSHAGELLCTDRLVEELWGTEPPANAPNALQAHVARLRRLLPGPPPTTDRVHGEERQARITTLPAGYLLSLGRATTDVQHFDLLCAQSRSAAAGDPHRAGDLLHQALSLWRGPALQDSRYGPLGSMEADRLEEQRLATLEALYELRLRCARHSEITGELERLTAGHPLRERFYDLLMVALYRSGRQAEALGVYERARRCLVSGLGIEPGPALHARMQAILHQSPGLSTPHGTGTSAGAGPQQPHLDGEIARLQQRIDDLDRQQRALLDRFETLTAHQHRAS
ncbi:winged helix-turn-helix domain-containing protein [Streptomyces sp. NBC_01167]|uniref:AfsR/SARP family transcriptional regulator n=1 Tax=Streptomyces sp. NBC_01167 TaxID=2903756 RepID=UPI00386CC5DD|nr:winged helix-turn-helix domain-containing protein [Streptomyces sp. NBC_01167]